HYDSDISHLRLCISTCTNALQLPVIIQNIHASARLESPPPSAEDLPDLLGKLLDRMTNLESSMERTKNDLVARGLQRNETPSAMVFELASTEEKMKELELGVSARTAAQQPPAAVAEFQTAITKPRTDLTEQEEKEDGGNISPDAAEAEQQIEMEQDTRSLLGLTRGLIEQVQSYASTIDSASTSSRLTRPSSKIPQSQPDRGRSAKVSALGTSIDSGPHFDLRAQLSQQKRDVITCWAGRIDNEDDVSVTFMSSATRTYPSPSAETTTKTIQSISSVSTGSIIMDGELNQRRLRKVGDSMKSRDYEKAIPLVDRLLRSGDDLEGLIRLLRPCKPSTESLEESRSGSVEPKVLSNIHFVLSKALLRSGEPENRDEAIPILEKVIERGGLEPVDKGSAHELLAEAYRSSSDFDNAMSHGTRACQIKLDLLGRDDEETLGDMERHAFFCTRFAWDPAEEEQTAVGTERQTLVKCTEAALLVLNYDIPHGKDYDLARVTRLRGSLEHSNQQSEKSVSRSFLGQPVLCWSCLADHISRANTLAAFEVGAVCSEHRIEGEQVTGFSPLHFFAMATPRKEEWETPRQDNCVAELSLGSSRSPAELRPKSKVVELTPLWVAATFGRQEVVDFLLSIRETNASLGAEVLTCVPDLDLESQLRSSSVLAAFHALSTDQARQILATGLPHLAHWCFAHPLMLDGFLQKCGPGSANLEIRPSRLSNALALTVTEKATRLLPLCISLLSPTPDTPSSVPTEESVRTMLQTILKYGAKEADSQFMMSGCSADIKYLLDLSVGHAGTVERKPGLHTDTIRRLHLLLDLLGDLRNNGIILDQETRDDLLLWYKRISEDELLEDKRQIRTSQIQTQPHAHQELLQQERLDYLLDSRSRLISRRRRRRRVEDLSQELARMDGYVKVDEEKSRLKDSIHQFLGEQGAQSRDTVGTFQGEE
ncbi:hypothetical protein FZEAL_10130, partial [Fusarium zealandicum]